jgi:hypothetical protein
MDIVLAIVLGTAFGFVLQRIGAADPDKIIGMLRLTDLHLMKTILLAIGVSSALLFLGLAVGVLDGGNLSVKTAYPGVLVGGLLLGAGWALGGYCPGTGVVALGSGRKDAIAFIVGGLVGAGLFIVTYEGLAGTGLFDKMFGGKVTLADTGAYDALLGLPGLLVALAIGGIMIAAAFLLPKALRGADGDATAE